MNRPINLIRSGERFAIFSFQKNGRCCRHSFRPGRFVLALWIVGGVAVAEDNGPPPEIRRLIRAAGVYDEAGMLASVKGLVRRGPSCLPDVAALLEHEDANVRWQAIVTMHRMAVAAEILRPGLSAAAGDRDADVRGAAVDALARLFPHDSRTRKAIATLRHDPQPLVRAKAHAADWLVARQPRAITSLIELLSDEDWMAVQSASRSLARIGRPAQGPLMKSLHERALPTRVAAVRTLGRMQNPNREAVACFARLAVCGQHVLAVAATRALADSGNLGWPALRRLTEENNATVRARAVRAIGTARRKLPEAGRVLHRRLEDHDPLVRVAAMEAIGPNLQPDAAMVAALTRRLADDRPDQRAAALAALSRLGSAARQALPEVRRLAETEKIDYIRRSARQIVRQATESGRTK